MTDLKAAAQAVADAFANPNAKANLNGRTLHLFDCLTELRKALAEEEEKPVARVLQTVGQYHTGRFVAEIETTQRLRDGENLYTHPPRRHWVSLTDEEIQTIVNKVATGTYQTSDTFARDIEAALKERNHE
jgi:hypothetical protein